MRVGIIGLGFMGAVHLRNWQAIDGVDVVAVCDAKPISKKATQGNLDVAGDELNLDGVSIYTQVADMLAAESLDVVSITLPTHLHKAISMQCLEAGTHVLCEKPMALSVEDCDEMIATAKKAGKQLMIAHCIRFWPEYAWVKKALDEERFGAVRVADFSRLTYSASWASDNWLSDPTKSGGVALDLHIHDLDFIQYLFGAPKSIASSVTKFENGVVGHLDTTLEYGENQLVKATASWMMPESFVFEMSFRILCEKATFILNSHAELPLTVYPVDGEKFVPELPEGDGYKGEIEYFAHCLLNNKPLEAITPEQARESVRMALETVQ